MIVIVHNEQKVVALSIDGIVNTSFNNKWITDVVAELVKEYPSTLLVWCHQSAEQYVDWTNLALLFDQDRKMLSYQPEVNFLPNSIGYVEDSIFIKVNKKVPFPTWQMSSYVGGIATSVLRQVEPSFWETKHFDFFLNSVAKAYQSQGLFCYSEPKLLQYNTVAESYSQATTKELFSFVAQHYKWVWKHFLLLNLCIYEKQFPLGPWILSFFKTQKRITHLNLTFKDNVIKKNFDLETIDVIIPTIGRKKYLWDVLKDLSAQTHLPKNVIIVEQNPQEGSVSELDYLESESWPFSVRHIFTHQTGACQARNRALEWVESKWCFFADDDIRFEEDLLMSALRSAYELQIEVVNLSCLRLNDTKTMRRITQWSAFGSGCSIVKSSIIKDLEFKTVYEFGFGEDTDFGMQIRNKGYDVIYLPEPSILHLKAPMGGFRTKPVLEWHTEKIAPKPSPTVMLYGLMHKTKQQLLGYKMILFLKYYKVQTIKNPWVYFKTFQKQWQGSMKWAKILQSKYEV